MKQKEYDQWNDLQQFYSEDYFLPKKGVTTPHEYLVECYHDLKQRLTNVDPTSWRRFDIDTKLF